MRHEKSCGAVVFTRENGSIRYVIISSLTGDFGFPKGHAEGGESEEQTAYREIKEETGLTVSFIDGFKTSEEYFLMRDGVPSVKKRVEYFLAEYKDQTFSLQRSELSDIRLMAFDEALNSLKHESTKRMLTEANTFLNSIRLVAPDAQYSEQIMEFKREVLEADGNSFDGCGDLQSCSSAEEWLRIIESRKLTETAPKGSVPSDTYLAIRNFDNRLVGIIDLRHHIDHPILSVWGGHIGYTVRPLERRKGYAKEMLRQNLLNCASLGISKVLITCSSHNTASEKTIIANGAVFEKEIVVDGEKIKRYWITVN